MICRKQKIRIHTCTCINKCNHYLRLHTVSVNLFDISVKKHLCNAFNSFTYLPAIRLHNMCT